MCNGRIGMCLYVKLVQTKNKQCKSAIILQCYSGSGSVSGNVVQRMSRHTVVTVNSDGGTCNAEAVHKRTQTGTSAEKQFVHYVHMS